MLAIAFWQGGWYVALTSKIGDGSPEPVEDPLELAGTASNSVVGLQVRYAVLLSATHQQLQGINHNNIYSKKRQEIQENNIE